MLRDYNRIAKANFNKHHSEILNNKILSVHIAYDKGYDIGPSQCTWIVTGIMQMSQGGKQNFVFHSHHKHLY